MLQTYFLDFEFYNEFTKLEVENFPEFDDGKANKFSSGPQYYSTPAITVCLTRVYYIIVMIYFYRWTRWGTSLVAVLSRSH